MRRLENYRVQLTISSLMISLPLFFAFLAGAGAGTVFDSIASFAGTVWSIFGGASLILGLIWLGGVLIFVWRDQRKEIRD